MDTKKAGKMKQTLGSINEDSKADRDDSGKPAYHLLSIRTLADICQADIPENYTESLRCLGRFQARIKTGIGDSGLIHRAIMNVHSLDNLDAAASVMSHGCEKYAAWNWAHGMDYSKCIGSALRHMVAIAFQEQDDLESRLPHIGHYLCNLFFLDHYVHHPARYAGFDDRPRRENDFFASNK